MADYMISRKFYRREAERHITTYCTDQGTGKAEPVVSRKRGKVQTLCHRTLERFRVGEPGPFEGTDVE